MLTKDRIALLAAILGIIVAALTVLGKFGILIKYLPFNWQPDTTAEILNILVLFYFFIHLRPTQLVLKDHEEMIYLAQNVDMT